MKQKKGRRAAANELRPWEIHIGTRFTKCHRELGFDAEEGILDVGDGYDVERRLIWRCCGYCGVVVNVDA